ncbi:MAG: hypothetical protein ACLTE2_03050 [Eubacteriales bacterium]
MLSSKLISSHAENTACRTDITEFGNDGRTALSFNGVLLGSA